MIVKFEKQFQADLKKIVRAQPAIKEELQELILVITELGRIPESYDPHLLTNARGNYTGYWGLHLQEGRFDVIAVYYQNDSELIRFIRIGSHQELFQCKQL